MTVIEDKPGYIPTKPQIENKQESFQTPTYKNPPPMPSVKPPKPDDE